MTQDWFRDVFEFHEKFGCKIGERPGVPDAGTSLMRNAISYTTAHALERFRERINPRATARMVMRLSRDAVPPSDAEWRLIVRGTRAQRLERFGKSGRIPSRSDFRVLGTIVFVVDGEAIVTCWRLATEGV